MLSRVTVDEWLVGRDGDEDSSPREQHDQETEIESENERGQSLAGRSLTEQKATACLRIANSTIYGLYALIKAVSIVDSKPESSVETS